MSVGAVNVELFSNECDSIHLGKCFDYRAFQQSSSSELVSGLKACPISMLITVHSDSLQKKNTVLFGNYK